MLWVALPVHDILAFISGIFRLIFLTASADFEFYYGYHDWINQQVHEEEMKITCRKTTEISGNDNKQQVLYIFPLFILQDCRVHFPACWSAA